MTSTLVILRSVPGGGKTSLIPTIERLYNHAGLICSADDYHYFNLPHEKENYKFDLKNLKAAHDQCKNKFLEGIKSCYPLIIIDNTNIKEKDWKYYYNIAKENNYNIVFHTIIPGTTEQHFNSNVHNVPKDVIERMIVDLKPTPKTIDNEMTEEILYDFNELRKK